MYLIYIACYCKLHCLRGDVNRRLYISFNNKSRQVESNILEIKEFMND